MSDSLDKIFRDRQANVPPSSPPPGQWERIRSRELVVGPVARQSSTGWQLVLVLLLGIGLGVFGGAYLFGSQCPGGAEVGEGDTTAGSAALPNGTHISVETLVPLTSPAPASAPESTLLSASALSSQFDNQPVESQATLKAPRNTIQSITASDKKQPISNAFAKAEAPADPRVVLKTETDLKRPENVEKPGRTSPNVVITQVPTVTNAAPKSIQFGSLQSTLVVAATALASTNPVPIKRRKSKQRGSWEFGINLTPGQSAARSYVSIYTEIDNGFASRQYDFGDRELTLYDASRLYPNLNRRLQMKFVTFDLARQFDNGLRVGLGITWRPSHLMGLRNERDFTANQLLPEEWGSTFRFGSQAVYTSARLDYTFLRRRRLRPYAGVSLQTLSYSDYNLREQLYEGRTGNSETVRAESGANLLFFRGLQVRPRAGFQYDLSERFSVGAEIVPWVGVEFTPWVGVGGRYKW